MAGLADNSCYSFESRNFAGRFIRHTNAELWLAPGAGGATWGTAADFKADASWHVVLPWAP